MVMMPGVVLSGSGSGSDGVDFGAGSIGCASFDDDGNEMVMHIGIVGEVRTAAETGIDRKHWRVVFRNPRPKASSRQDTIKLSLRILAEVVGKERAPESLYDVNNCGFGCEVSEEEGREFWFIDGVQCSLFDSYRRGSNGEFLGEYSNLEEKFPGPDDDDLSEYRKYLYDWEAVHGRCVFCPHSQQPVNVDPRQSKEWRVRNTLLSMHPRESKERRVRNTLLFMWQEACEDGFTLVTSKKSNYIKKQVMEKEGNQATKEQVKLALEMHALRKFAEQAVEQQARALEKLAKECQCLEVRKQALEKRLQEKQAKQKEALEKQI